MKLVGKVTEEEKKEILQLHERITAIKELLIVVSDKNLCNNNELYEKIVNDMGKTKGLYDAWWSKMAEQYQWEGREKGSWRIDFSTNEIILMDGSCCK